ncbi:DUF1638 domain-containing protein [Pseudooceanicola sediminis]|uniref:DUF1638 domain-containing protein n=1 Tax=Pseudooceanicola sediminis TaxID=2211117 RepID=A0A399J546_9RHOB|nr:DUF1638 domain-containing protein [Pseudooceanicola sediminis]KAA2317176.1 DUF1638 domain-containing protein [Puniceibacterium sp. HSS470]RII40474.1 DUF1638 domain-containing protein [Pseudooceanicola sediminis]|tara:strand:- start:57681 stop:58334 length:654 start_codon:yes stop_codon:yes gene_type:complete
MTTLPSDPVLTKEGADLRDQAPGAERTLLIACGALAREVLALKQINAWDHMDLICLPAILHNTPDLITDAVRAKVAEHRARYPNIFVLYADCGTGGLLEAACIEMGVQMLSGPHCYAFFDGVEAFEARGEVTSFYLTDFLARQFDAFVWHPLGLDRHPELKDMYFANYEALVYLAQTDDPALTKKARACADRLGLRFERRYTGYGDLARELAKEASQ